MSDETTTTPAPGARTGGATTIMAGTLWAIVGSLLGYGIFQTIVKAAALFTG